MRRTPKRSGFFLALAGLLLSSLLLGMVCTGTMPAHAKCMSTPMPSDKDQGTPACCVHHHLAMSVAPAYRQAPPSPFVAGVVCNAPQTLQTDVAAAVDFANHSPSPPGARILRI